MFTRTQIELNPDGQLAFFSHLRNCSKETKKVSFGNGYVSVVEVYPESKPDDWFEANHIKVMLRAVDGALQSVGYQNASGQAELKCLATCPIWASKAMAAAESKLFEFAHREIALRAQTQDMDWIDASNVAELDSLLVKLASSIQAEYPKTTVEVVFAGKFMKGRKFDVAAYLAKVAS